MLFDNRIVRLLWKSQNEPDWALPKLGCDGATREQAKSQNEPDFADPVSKSKGPMKNEANFKQVDWV